MSEGAGLGGLGAFFVARETMQIDRIPLARMKPAGWNPRLLKTERFQNLCASMKADPEFLWRRPILAMGDGTIYAGNQRYRAAEALGWSDVPAVLEDVPEQLAKERALRDNQNWGEWQEDELAELLYGLKEAGSAIDLLGFDSAELDRLLASVSGPELAGDPDEVPEPPVDPITKPGDLWLLGDHRVLCGDSTNLTDVERLMDGRRAQMVFTDPPYGVDYTGGRNPVSNTPREKLAGDASAGLYADALAMCTVATDYSAPVYVWFAGSIGEPVYSAVLNAGYKVRALLIWNKVDAHYGNFMAQYLQKHEPCLYCVKEPPAWYGPTNEVTVWDVKQPTANEYHPTQKPVELAERAMRNSSQRGDIVLDLFGGSGSTLIAAEQLGRKAYLMEIEPKYADVIVARWEKLTGRKAVLEEAAVAV